MFRRSKSSTGGGDTSSSSSSNNNSGNAHSQPEPEELLISRISALITQEQRSYLRKDYLSRTLSSLDSSDTTIESANESHKQDENSSQQGRASSPTSIVRTSSTFSSSSSDNSEPINEGSLPIDAECRSVMISWYHQVLDHCTFSRENGGIATYLLDLYLSTDMLGLEALVDRRKFQLVSMTALFLAIKMNECETITPGMVAKLSRGSFGALDVAHMETIMLRALQWRVSPPTPLTFVHHYMEILRACCLNPQETTKDDSTRLKSVLKYSKIQVELSSADYYFVTVNPSIIAYTAILNAATCLGRKKLSPSTLTSFHRKLVDHELIDISSTDYLSSVRDRLIRCVEGPSTDEESAGSGSDEEVAANSSTSPGSPRTEGKSVDGNKSPGRRSPRSVATK